MKEEYMRWTKEEQRWKREERMDERGIDGQKNR